MENFVELYDDGKFKLYGNVDTIWKYPLLTLQVHCGNFAGQSTLFLGQEHHRYLNELQQMHTNLSGKCTLQDAEGLSSYLCLEFQGRDLLINGLFEYCGNPKLTFENTVDQTILGRLINLINVPQEYDLSRISIEEKYGCYTSALKCCGEFLLDKSDKDVSAFIFDKFDDGVTTFLKEEVLKDLLLQGYMDDEIHDLSKNLYDKYVAIKHTSLWKVSCVRTKKQWKEILQLSDKIKQLLRQFEIKRKESNSMWWMFKFIN